MRRDYSQFQARGTEIVVVVPEDMSELRAYWEKEDLPFVGVTDSKHQVADQYGQEVKLLRFGRLPALMVIDRDGRMHLNHHGNWNFDIPHNKDVLKLLDKINQSTAQT